MTDLIERLRNMRAVALAARTQDEYTSAGELFIRSSEEVIETIRALTSERDFLRSERDVLRTRIESAVKVENFRRYSCGHEYIDISGTDETEVTNCELYGKRVALVLLEDGE